MGYTSGTGFDVMPDLIKNISYDQSEIIRNILRLHVPGRKIDCDPTFSTGGFYNGTGIEPPKLCFDIEPQAEGVVQADARHLPLENESIPCMMFDPPYYDEKGWNPSENVKDFTDTFEAIRCFYQLMKSGYNGVRSGEYERSFLFQYMHGLGIGNEKAWMKQQHISPAIGAKSPEQTDKTPRYVRALLGTAGNVSYQEEPKGRVNVTISNEELPRVPSPVFFKVVKDTVFITASPIPKEVYGKSYTFTGDRRRGYASGEISTPETELFASGAFEPL